MKQFTSTQLQQNTSDVTSVATYEPVIITVRGRPMFELRPVKLTHSVEDISLLRKTMTNLGISSSESMETTSSSFLSSSRKVFRAVNKYFEGLNNGSD